MSTSATATQVSQRKQYETQGIDGDHLNRSAFAQFQAWFDEANAHADIAEAAAMTLSTVELVASAGQAAIGRPSARVVLLKQFDRRGFTFYTNYDSRKGGELARNPFAALTFYWPPLHRSVRIGGRVERLTPAENRAYFDSRPLGSRIGAIASPQSRPIDGRATLEERVRAVEEQYGVVGAAGLNSSSAEAAKHDEKTAIDLPSHWGGFRVVPDEIEFWMGRLNRLHDRFRYTRDSKSEEDEWTITRLAP